MMTDEMFPDLPEQREGPITVDGRTLAQCPVCYGIGTVGHSETYCRECNGGGVVLVRA